MPRDDAASTPKLPPGRTQISPSIQKFPAEVLVTIFELLHESQGAAASLSLSHVCGLWRNIVTQTSTLWRRTNTLTVVADDAQRQRDLSLLALCDQYSNGTLTHASIIFDESLHVELHEEYKIAQGYLQAIEIISRSHKTLLSLQLHEFLPFECECRYGNPLPCPPHERPSQAASLASARILQLICQAERLHTLSLDMLFPHGLSFDGMQLAAKSTARPKRVTLTTPGFGCPTNSPALMPGFHAFFGELVTEAAHFDYNPGIIDGDIRWAWLTFLRGAQHRESCNIFIDVESLASLPLVTFPRLREATLLNASKADAHTWRAAMPTSDVVRLRMPALRNVCTYAELALIIDCPRVRRAHVLIDTEQDLAALSSVLSNWPELDTLTISVNQSELRSATTACIQAVVVALTPSLCGGVVSAPRLRHLGLRCDYHSLRPEIGCVSTPMDYVWPLTPAYTENERAVWTYNGICPAYDTRLSADIVQLVTERRRLHSGRDTRIRCPSEAGAKENINSRSKRRVCALQGQCSPLETLKIGGLDMDVTVWATLLKDFQTCISCFPEPLDTGSAALLAPIH